MTCVGSEVAQAYWKDREQAFAEDPRAWCVHYWESWRAAYRQTLALAVRDRLPTSVLELGCNVGPNLRVLRGALWASTLLSGVDVNRAAVEFGRGQFQAMGDDRVALYVGPFEEGFVHVAHPDVVVSCYALAYLGPEDVVPLIRAAWARTRRALVLAEPSTVEATALVHTASGEWCHNWSRVFMDAGVPAAAVRYTPLETGTRLNGLWCLDKVEAA